MNDETMSNEYWTDKKMTDEQWTSSTMTEEWMMKIKNKHDEGNSKGSKQEERRNWKTNMHEWTKEGRNEWMNDVGWWWKFQLQKMGPFLFSPMVRCPRCPRCPPLPGTVKSTDLASRCTVMVKWLETKRSGVSFGFQGDNLGIFQALSGPWRSW